MKSLGAFNSPVKFHADRKLVVVKLLEGLDGWAEGLSFHSRVIKSCSWFSEWGMTFPVLLQQRLFWQQCRRCWREAGLGAERGPQGVPAIIQAEAGAECLD